MAKKQTRRPRRDRRPRTVPTAHVAKAWLLAQPAFQRMMLTLAERFAEHIVASFGATSEPIPNDMTFGEWLGPAGSRLYYWDKCDDDILGDPLLAAVRALELDVLRGGRNVVAAGEFDPAHPEM